MKQLRYIVFVIALSLFHLNSAAGSEFSTIKTVTDTTKAKAKKDKRKEGKQKLKDSHQIFFVRVNYVYAKLRTTLTFDVEKSIFSANIGLESDFKLPGTRFFFTGTLIYRFTLRSGLYAAYYGIMRSTTHTTEKDYIFLGHTIPTGVTGTAFFNTRVLSVGYILTVVQKKHVYLGAYFNVYVMNLTTGFKAQKVDIDVKLGLTLPLPSFGFAAIFPVNNWFRIHANVGYFGLSFDDLGGAITNFELAFEFKPIRWLGLNLSYQSFDINVYDIQDGIDFIVDYNFKGPAFGVSVNF
jgi:hypothetical protein